MRGRIFTAAAILAVVLAIVMVVGSVLSYRDGQRQSHDDYCRIMARNQVQRDDCP